MKNFNLSKKDIQLLLLLLTSLYRDKQPNEDLKQAVKIYNEKLKDLE